MPTVEIAAPPLIVAFVLAFVLGLTAARTEAPAAEPPHRGFSSPENFIAECRMSQQPLH